MMMRLQIWAVLSALVASHGHGPMVGESGKWEEGDEWIMEEGPAVLHEDGFVLETTSYTSPQVKLKTGEAHFTLNPLTHVPWPKGDSTIIRAVFQIVGEDGSTQTPLSEVYNHHWLVGTSTSTDPLKACEDNLFYGAGAEMRGMNYSIPKGFGFRRVEAKGFCGANLHFIRTEDLATSWKGMNDPKGDYHAAVKNCIECGYAPGRAPLECHEKNDGEFNCCFTGSRCPVNTPSNHTQKAYLAISAQTLVFGKIPKYWKSRNVVDEALMMNWDSDDSDDRSSDGGQLLPHTSFLEQFQELKFQAIRRHALQQAKKLSEDPVRPRCRICTLPILSCPKRDEHEEIVRQRDEAAEEARRAAEEEENSNPGGSPPRRSRSPQPPAGSSKRRSEAGAGNQGPGRIRSPGGGPAGQNGHKDFRSAGRRYFQADGADQEELERRQQLAEYHAQKQQARAELEQAKKAEWLRKQAAARAKEEKRKARGAALKDMLVKQTDEKARREEEKAAEAEAHLIEVRKKEDRRKKQMERQRMQVDEWRAKKEAQYWDTTLDGFAPADTDRAMVSERYSMAATS